MKNKINLNWDQNVSKNQLVSRDKRYARDLIVQVRVTVMINARSMMIAALIISQASPMREKSKENINVTESTMNLEMSKWLLDAQSIGTVRRSI